MFGREKPTKALPAAAAPVSGLETTIGSNTFFRGDIQSDGGIRVQGVFEGNIDITGNLVITDGAKVVGEVTANNISVSGQVNGNVNGNRVEILETGRVWGDLTVNSLLLNEGAYLLGQVTMHGDIQPPLIEAPKSRRATETASSAIVDVEPKPQISPVVED
jgi:cytoskeletal protein CcmA (bactofilin family)